MISDDKRSETVMPPDLKCDFSGNVNVEEMDFAVESHQLSYRWVNGIDQAASCVRTNLGANTL